MIRRLAVVIPAADEEERIGRCLLSVVTARSYLYRTTARVHVQVIVVLDGCRDDTAGRAAAFGDVQLVTIQARNVGAARRAGAAAALQGGGPASELWLANTDADSQVPADWLSYMVAESRRGAHLVLGTALPGPALGSAARADWLSRHQLREGHPHVHGANLGIRGDAYLALGGWPAVVTGEDVELARRAARTGHLRVARTASIPVITSTRHRGRAPHGFSSYLRALGHRDALPAGAARAVDVLSPDAMGPDAGLPCPARFDHDMSGSEPAAHAHRNERHAVADLHPGRPFAAAPRPERSPSPSHRSRPKDPRPDARDDTLAAALERLRVAAAARDDDLPGFVPARRGGPGVTARRAPRAQRGQPGEPGQRDQPGHQAEIAG